MSNNTYALDPLGPEDLANTLDQLIDSHPTAKRTTVTLKVVDLETGEVLYDRGGDKLLVPASNLKIYTAAAALDLLGPDFRWTTGVRATQPIRRGVCRGDLLIFSTGDPMLDTEQLGSIADKLVSDNHLKRVKGSIRVLTPPRWQNLPLKGPGWMWDDEPDYYNMSIRSVMLNYNTIEFTVSHGDKGVVLEAEPPSDWPPVKLIVHNPPGQNPGARFERTPFQEPIRVIVDLGPGAEPVSDRITMHDPKPWIASVFKRMLEDRGVAVSGDDVGKHAVGAAEVSRQGKPLAEAIEHFLKVSENAVGEMLLLKLAETQTDEDVSWPVGAEVITDWLVNTAGLEDGSFRLVDGSGLSRYNLISADSSVKLLAFMKTHEHFEPFYDGLNAYKVAFPENEKWDGVPLAEFDDERVHAKSGGMTGVATLSGYVQTLDGRWLAFSFLANGYVGSRAPVFDLRNAVWPVLVKYRPMDVKDVKPSVP